MHLTTLSRLLSLYRVDGGNTKKINHKEKPTIVINSGHCILFLPQLWSEELIHVSSELHAVDIQIQELLERQQELIQKKRANEENKAVFRRILKLGRAAAM